VTGAERRAQLTADIAERTGIARAMIERLVRGFCAKVMTNALLAPIFEARIRDWELFGHFADCARPRELWLRPKGGVSLVDGSTISLSVARGAILLFSLARSCQSLMFSLSLPAPCGPSCGF
jgi:hypothetical protein